MNDVYRVILERWTKNGKDKRVKPLTVFIEASSLYEADKIAYKLLNETYNTSETILDDTFRSIEYEKGA